MEEKIIRLLIAVSVVSAALLALILLCVAIHYIRTRSMVKRLLKRGTRGRDFVYDLLKTSFPSGRLFQKGIQSLNSIAVLFDGVGKFGNASVVSYCPYRAVGIIHVS